jgi:hypothetical protein
MVVDCVADVSEELAAHTLRPKSVGSKNALVVYVGVSSGLLAGGERAVRAQ